jgi:hypothetical protein
MLEDEIQDDAPRRSLLRRYAGPVILGVVLGIGLLYVLSRFAAPPAGQRLLPAEDTRDTQRAADAAKLQALDPELVVTEQVAPPADSIVAYVEPPVCAEGVEAIECWLATVESKWPVAVTSDSSDGGGAIQVPVGSGLRWQVTSEQRGLLTSFLVEENGGVLLIYPSPGGEMPVLEGGVGQQVPRAADQAKMTWSRPGLRRVFALVSTTPFVTPEGRAAGKVATYFAPGEASAAFFAELRNQVFQDQVSQTGEWALGEARFEVVEP